MIAAATALMPTTAHDHARDGVRRTDQGLRTPPKNLPTSAPRNSEAKNRPPRKPEPMETAEAIDFSTTSSADPGDAGSGAAITRPIAPCPGGQHRRRDQRQQPDDGAADHRAQPRGQAALAEQLLGQGHAAHDGDADQRADHAEHQDRE